MSYNITAKVVVVKEELPPKGARTVPVANRKTLVGELTKKKVLALLKQEAGDWFKVLEYPANSRSGASVAARNLNKKLEGYEFAARGHNVYGRYVNGQGD